MLPNKILIVSTMRSGTHLLHEILRRKLNFHQNLVDGLFLHNVDLDQINFIFGSDGNNVYTCHWESITRLSRGQIERLNRIIEIRNIHVVYLHRLDFINQLLSRIILGYYSERDKIFDDQKSNKIYIKKNEVVRHFRHLKSTRDYNNPDLIPLIIHSKVTYEQIVDNEININGINVKFEMDKLNTKKSKKNVIKNHESVLKWIDECFEKYDEQWIPYSRWDDNGS